MTARRKEKWHAAPKFVVKLDIRLHDILQKLRKGRGDGRSERAVHIAVCTLLDSVTHSPANGRAIPFEFDVVLHNNWRKTWRINRQCLRGLSVLVQPLLLPAVFDRFLNLLGKLVEFAIDGEDACVRRGLLDGVDAALNDYLSLQPQPKQKVGRPRVSSADEKAILGAWDTEKFTKYEDCAEALGLMRETIGKRDSDVNQGPDGGRVKKIVRNRDRRERYARKKANQ